VLYVVATPIGNLEDITHRAVRVLGEADVLACEDTRRTGILLKRYEIPRPQRVISYHEHNEERVGRQILELLAEGLNVALCTDSGYPSVSDPGYKIISAAREAGISIEVIPGASAVTMAIVASGLPTSSYTFKGFSPRKSGQRKRFLEMDRDQPHTIVLFESPHRTHKLLVDAIEVLGDRLAAVCVELTKKFERVDRGYLTELATMYEGKKVRGEVTVVIAGNNPKFFNPEAEQSS